MKRKPLNSCKQESSQSERDRIERILPSPPWMTLEQAEAYTDTPAAFLILIATLSDGLTLYKIGDEFSFHIDELNEKNTE